MRIESSDKRIDELLKANTFVIPRFQRPYSWEAEHVGQFWTDILENIKTLTSLDQWWSTNLIGRRSLWLTDSSA